METVRDFIFLSSQIMTDGDCNHEIKTLSPWKKSYDKPRHLIRKQRHHFSNKGPYSQIYGFSSSHIPMWELDHKEGWAPKNWCFQTAALEKAPESRLDSKEIKPVYLKGNQPWILTERTDAEVKLQYFGHLMQRADSLEKTLILGKTEGKRRREWQRMKWLDGITDSMDTNLGKHQEMMRDKEAWRASVHEITELDMTWLLNDNNNHL